MKELISLLPEDYIKEDQEKYDSRNNYILFTFYEHSDFMKKYVLKKRYPDDPSKQHKIKFLERIKLPINRDIFKITTDAPYSHDKLNYIPNLLYESIQKYGGSPEAMQSAMKEAEQESEETLLDELWEGTKNISKNAIGATAGYLSAVALDSSQDSQFTTGVKFAEGVAYNPNRRLIYEGENLVPRVFQLVYNFSPKSKKEIKSIRKAEYVISKNTLPELWSGFGSLSSKYVNHFKYPKKVKVEIYIGGEFYKKHQILDSVISSFQVIQNGKDTGKETFIKDEDENIYSTDISFNIQITETQVFTRNLAEKVFEGV